MALGAGAGERQDDPLAGVLNDALKQKFDLYHNFVNHKKQPWEYGQLIWEMFKEQGIQPAKEW